MTPVRYLIYTIAVILYAIVANAVMLGTINLTKEEKISVFGLLIILTFIIATKYNRIG